MPHPEHEEDPHEMTVGSSVDVPASPAQPFDGLTILDQLQEQVRSAEHKAAGLERALATNRRIGIAIGILMCQRRLTEDEAIAVLMTQSQDRNVKMRELAETVIYTGTL